MRKRRRNRLAVRRGKCPDRFGSTEVDSSCAVSREGW